MSMKRFSDLSNHLGSQITQRDGARGGNHHYCPSFNPLTYRGGGEILAQTIRLLTITLNWWLSFYLLHFGRVLAKSINQGVAAVVFEIRPLEKLNILIFCFA